MSLEKDINEKRKDKFLKQLFLILFLVSLTVNFVQGLFYSRLIDVSDKKSQLIDKLIKNEKIIGLSTQKNMQ